MMAIDTNTDRLEGLPSDPSVLIDAECVLCSANAQFILAHDEARRFYLAPMQGEAKKALLRRYGLDPAIPTSILVSEGITARKDSDAVLYIYEGLGCPWRLASLLRVVPRFARDVIYRLVARCRYRLFGKRPSCWVRAERFARAFCDLQNTVVQ